jgi:hypothetical protein
MAIKPIPFSIKLSENVNAISNMMRLPRNDWRPRCAIGQFFNATMRGSTSEADTTRKVNVKVKIYTCLSTRFVR